MGEVIPLEKFAPKRNLPIVVDVPAYREESRAYSVARLVLEVAVYGFVGVVVAAIVGLFVAFIGAMFALVWQSVYAWMLWLLTVPFAGGALLCVWLNRPGKQHMSPHALQQSATIVELRPLNVVSSSQDPPPAA